MINIISERKKAGRTMYAAGIAGSIFVHGILVALLILAKPYKEQIQEAVEIEIAETEKPKEPEKKAEEPEKQEQEKVAVMEPKPQPRPQPEIRKKVEKEEPKEPESEKKSPPSFGLNLSSSTTAAPGTGIAIKEGDTLTANPSVPETEKTKKRTSASGDDEEDVNITSEKLASVKTMPRVKTNVHVEYPVEIKSLEIQGRVVLQLWIDEQGRVIKAKVIKKLHPKLDELALEAAKKIIFEPATIDGKPVTVKIPYSFVFVLD
jgi:protein TonB